MKALDLAEHKRRRQQLMMEMGTGSVAVLPAAPVSLRNNDVDYVYRQDSHFDYLCGFQEADAVLVLVPGGTEGQELLFCQEKDPNKERWSGLRVGQEAAIRDYGFDQCWAIQELDDRMLTILGQCKQVYTIWGRDADFDKQLVEWLNRLRKAVRQGSGTPSCYVALEHWLNASRLIKSPAEIDQMQKAADISVLAHEKAMQECQSGMYEYEIEAGLMDCFMRQGCRHAAYPSIVAGGENACILHYTNNDAVLKDGDLLLLDAGAEFAGYAADITRTIPVNGRFSESQKTLYELVLAAQLAAIAVLRPGVSYRASHEAAVAVLTKGLLALGLLSGDYDDVIRDEAYTRFYMHGTSHWLGRDVHDVGEYKQDGDWRLLEEGMTLTIEPGLYISPADDIDEKWWNIGIRIEDDVLVTATGSRVLTAALVKSVVEIESLMQ